MITRATLPTEFLDLTSAMMLQAPEPQYLLCQFWKMGLHASFKKPTMLGFMQDRAIVNGGGQVPSMDAMQLMFEDPIFAKAMVVVPELGNRPGHTVRVNRPFFANTTYTEAAREIVSGSSISTQAIDIANEQVAITLKRYGGPYGASSVQPFGVDKFDANLAIHSIVQLVGLHLERDFDKTLDTFLANILDLLPVIYPSGIIVDNDIVAKDMAPMTYEVLNEVEKQMDDASVPVFPDGKRVGIVTPHALQQLKRDRRFVTLVQYDKVANPVLSSSYAGTIGQFHLFKSATVPKNTNASSVVISKNQFFGPGVLGSGIGELPHVAYSTDDNYGEQAKVIWLMPAGFRLLDNRFGFTVRTG
jgi:hypothetical protein